MKGIHGYYFFLPLLTAAFWLTNIVGLLVIWTVRDKRDEYDPLNANIVFISNVGARHQTYFIIFSCLTAASYMGTVVAERYLRHLRRIPGSLHPNQTSMDIASVVFAFIGSVALILLSVFDAEDYSTVHWCMTLVFIVGVGVGVLLQTVMVFFLSRMHRKELWHLRAMAVFKSALLVAAAITLLVFIITYGICSGDAAPGDSRCDRVVSVAGVAEWLVSFLLFFFFLSYVVDLWPAKKSADKGLSADGQMVENRSLAEAHGEGHKPEAPYSVARSLGPNATPEQHLQANADAQSNATLAPASDAQRKQDLEKGLP